MGSRDTLLRRGDRFFLAILLLAGTCVAQQDVVESIVIHGNRRIPAETIRARMFTNPGDVYDQQALERDLQFPVEHRLFRRICESKREQSTKGWIIHVYVKEKPPSARSSMSA